MRVAMFTNTYLPLLGGVERSVASTATTLRNLGHACLVITPRVPAMRRGAHDGATDAETVRLAAFPSVAGTQFSYRLPGAGNLRRELRQFLPDVVHAHHPFMLGETGVRLARGNGVPVVFTCHTRWERFVPSHLPLLRRLARRLPVIFGGLCDLVIAPTPSIARLLRRRGVTTPIAVVPTGIDLELFRAGSRVHARARWGIRPGDTVVGHVGRLVPEKNVAYLAEAAIALLQTRPGRLLLVGEGPATAEVEGRFAAAGLGGRLVCTGRLDGQDLADAYSAMDVFAFTALTDTQGLVIAEAAAAGCPIVALDAPGPRDFVDGSNGLLVPAAAPPEAFAAALARALAPDAHAALSSGARKSADDYDLASCAERLVAAYTEAIARLRDGGASPPPGTTLQRAWWRLIAEWDLLGHKAALARVMLR